MRERIALTALLVAVCVAGSSCEPTHPLDVYDERRQAVYGTDSRHTITVCEAQPELCR